MLHPKQLVALRSKATEILYGAANRGKRPLLSWSAALAAIGLLAALIMRWLDMNYGAGRAQPRSRQGD